MKLAAANAIAGLVPDDELNEDNIMPEAFNPKVAELVAEAVKPTSDAKIESFTLGRQALSFSRL